MTLTVDAVVYYKVVDPVKALINVQNHHEAVSQVAQTSLRSVIGHADMDQLLSERERVNAGAQGSHRRTHRGTLGACELSALR